MDTYSVWVKEQDRISMRYGILVERGQRIRVSWLWARRFNNKERCEKLARSNKIIEDAILRLENPYK